MLRTKITAVLGVAAGLLLAAALLVQRSTAAAGEPAAVASQSVHTATEATGNVRRHLQTVPRSRGTCPTGRVWCGSQCTDVGADPLRCGRCNNKCFAPLNKMAYCDNGVCRMTASLSSCPTGKTKCKVAKLFSLFDVYGCVNVQTNNDHCGACNTKCQGDQFCLNGRCVCRPGKCACPTGRGNQVQCINRHAPCPRPGRVCDPADPDPVQCNPGFKDCDGNAANGCETPLNTPANCGDCGAGCASGPNSTPTCSGNPPICGLTCTPGFGNCDGNAANGCETPLNSPANCGGCGSGCPVRPNSTPTCTGNPPTCGLTCAPGFGNCDSNPVNGCETPVNTPTNCGGCGATCPSGPNSTPTCSGNPPTCGLTCAPGFGNCDSNPANGCETPLNTPANCGGCGAGCPVRPNSSPTCTGSPPTCGFTCLPGFKDCDGNPVNGCETVLNTVANCGDCGAACTAGSNASPTCSGGTCGLACSNGFGQL